MKPRTASPSPLASTRDLLPPKDDLVVRRKPRIRVSASLPWIAPSACFLVQPAPATNSNLASGRIVCSSALGACTPVTVVRVGGASTGTFSTFAAPAGPLQAVKRSEEHTSE